MTTAWEVTPEDVELVLEHHGVEFPEDHQDDGWERFWQCIDVDEVEDTVLRYTDFDEQCQAASADIEEMLMKNGIISGERHWQHP